VVSIEPRDTPPSVSALVSGTAANVARRVLVVDDNRDSAQSLAMMLQLMGHTTATAYDGEDAVERAAQFTPDVVLLDLGLPKIDGFEAARRIRALPHGAAMTLVALTGWSQEKDRRRSVEAGFDHYVVKPAKRADLEQLLS
jgi:CheY-like chemotaxis protein